MLVGVVLSKQALIHNVYHGLVFTAVTEGRGDETRFLHAAVAWSNVCLQPV